MRNFITDALALVSANYKSTSIVDTIITKGGTTYVGTIKSMNTNAIKIATDSGIQKINTKNIRKIKFGVKEDYINTKPVSNVIDIKERIINKQSNDKCLDEFLKHNWHGMLINPNNQKINVAISKNAKNIIISLSDKKFIARNVEINSNNELSFYILPEGKEKNKVYFKATFGKYKISGNIINSRGKTGYWTVYKDSVTCMV